MRRKIDSSVRLLCYLQIAAALVLVSYIAVYLPNALEWQHLSDESSPQTQELISMIRDEGVTGDRKDTVADVLESLINAQADQPKMYRATFMIAGALAVLLLVLPIVLLLRDRSGKLNDRTSA